MDFHESPRRKESAPVLWAKNGPGTAQKEGKRTRYAFTFRICPCVCGVHENSAYLLGKLPYTVTRKQSFHHAIHQSYGPGPK